MGNELGGVEVRSINEFYEHYISSEFENQDPPIDGFFNIDGSSAFGQAFKHSTAGRYEAVVAAQTDGSIKLTRHATAISSNDQAGVICSRYLKALVPGKQGEVIFKTVFQVKGSQYIVGIMCGELMVENGGTALYDAIGPNACILFDSNVQKIYFVISTAGDTDYGYKYMFDFPNQKYVIENDYTIYESQALPNFDVDGAFNVVELDVAISKGVGQTKAMHWMAKINNNPAYSKGERVKSNYFDATELRPFIALPDISSGLEDCYIQGLWGH